MKIFLFLITLLFSLAAHAQSDGGVDSCWWAKDLSYDRFVINDTNAYCGYYSGDGFVSAPDTNEAINSSLMLFNMGDAGHPDLVHPERTTMYLGIPGVDPWVYEDSCGHRIYKDVCIIYILDECGDTIAKNTKTYYNLAISSGFAVTRLSGKLYYNAECNNYLQDIYGPIDSTLADVTEASVDRRQASIPANYEDTYVRTAKRNSALVNKTKLIVGHHYWSGIKFNPPPSVHEGANLYKNNWKVPFTFSKATIKATAMNPDGYYPKVEVFPLDPVPPAPENLINTGATLAWSKVPAEVCTYKVERAMGYILRQGRGRGKKSQDVVGFYSPVVLGYTSDNSFIDTQQLPDGYYKYFVSAKTSGGYGPATNVTRLK